ncbi:MAG: hypothetical protein NT069_35545 [Planctomycetota bacterium]|nr:hypothetical protein [Planctomycetota bacterium]
MLVAFHVFWDYEHRLLPETIEALRRISDDSAYSEDTRSGLKKLLDRDSGVEKRIPGVPPGWGTPADDADLVPEH